MSVNGLYIPTDYSYSNISTTNASIVNLTVTTFNPVNVDSSNVTCDVLNCSSANISVKNTSTVNASTANVSTVNMSNSNVSTGTATQYNINDLILPSNGLYSDASIQTLGDQMRIKAGGTNTIGFLTDTDINMVYDGDLNISSDLNVSNCNVSDLKIYNSFGYYSNISRVGGELNITHSADEESDINFYTNTGTGAPKLKIFKNNDIVQVQNLNVVDTMESNQIISVNTSFEESNTSTLNASDCNISFVHSRNISNDVRVTTAEVYTNYIQVLNVSALELNSSTSNYDTLNASTINSSIKNVSQINTSHVQTHNISADVEVETVLVNCSLITTLNISSLNSSINTINSLVNNTSTVNSSILNSSSVNSSNVSITNVSCSYMVDTLFSRATTFETWDAGRNYAMNDYYSTSSTGPDGLNTEIIYPAFRKLSVWENYNILNMMAFNNDSVVANRFINIPVDTNISNLNVSTLNASNFTLPSQLNASNLNTSTLGNDGELITVNTSVLFEEMIQCDNTFNCSEINCSQFNVNEGTPTNVTMGHLELGDIGYASFAGLRHRNVPTNEFMILQSNAGLTIINAAPDQGIHFRLDNTTKWKMETTGAMTVMENVNVTNRFGKGILGSFGTANGFGVANRLMGDDEFMIFQNNIGNTTVNCGSEKIIVFAINNVSCGKWTSDGDLEVYNDLNVSGTINTSTVNVSSLNVSTSNTSTANVSTINVSDIACDNDLEVNGITNSSTVNCSSLNVSNSNTSTANVSTVNVSDIDCDNNLIVGGVNVITEINSKQDELTGGDGINITNSTISKDFTLTGIGSGKVSTNVVFSTLYSTDTEFFPDIWDDQELVDSNYYTYTTPTPTTNNSNEGIKILVAGYYRISYTLNLKNDSFNNRVNVRTRALRNGGLMNKGISFSYLRDQNFVQIGTCSTTFINIFSVDDFIKLQFQVSKNDTSFGDTLDGCELLSNTNLIIEYLGS
jgi:hypothetical protein